MNNQEEQSQVIKGAIEAQKPVEEKTTDLAPVQGEAELLISQAISRNVPVETMEKLLAMRRELKQERAKELFDKALASFQAACPVIEKNKVAGSGNFTYHYAPLEYVVEKVKAPLAEHGFSYTFDTKQTEKFLKVFCKVKHKDGYSEISEFEVAIDESARMNKSQQYGSALTYAKRYCFCNAFGIVIGGEDNDAQTTEQPLSARQMAYKKESAQTPTRPATPSSTPPTGGHTPPTKSYPISKPQITFIEKQMKEKGKTMAAVEAVIKEITNNRVSQLQKLTSSDADMLIKRLLKAPAKKAQKQIEVDEEESEQLANDVDAGLSEKEEVA